MSKKSHENESETGSTFIFQQSHDNAGRQTVRQAFVCCLSPVPEHQYRGTFCFLLVPVQMRFVNKYRLILFSVQSLSILLHGLTSFFTFPFCPHPHAHDGCSTPCLFLLALSVQHVPLSHVATQDLISNIAELQKHHKNLLYTRAGFIRVVKCSLDCVSSHRSTGAAFKRSRLYLPLGLSRYTLRAFLHLA